MVCVIMILITIVSKTVVVLGEEIQNLMSVVFVGVVDILIIVVYVMII